MADKPELDKDTYDSAREYLKEALTHMAEAGQQIHDLSEFALERFGDEFRPYLEQFYRDIREERIQLETLSHSLKRAFFGEPITAQERERRIREAAYLRAEKRGFIGSDIDDWLCAERLVDEQLAEQAGLMARGRQGVASLASMAGKELEGLQKAVGNWLESRGGTGTANTKPTPTAARTRASTPTKKAPVKKKAAKKAVKKKTGK